ncbi:uncharacterized protein KY384_001707 [Bacidia gigantensis]|uniref:uncharacterized protein n=1 Tax=Bacidia gigantensis TaxID=2732470 RepID=UPI001D03C2EE|nr:uncharacterized protein KY384_001707 [Bacidia gigantensis]KAG8533964.1 hypothetical protein KY384_001707 [Bacidia gigantensis]
MSAFVLSPPINISIPSDPTIHAGIMELELESPSLLPACAPAPLPEESLPVPEEEVPDVSCGIAVARSVSQKKRNRELKIFMMGAP